MKKSLFLITFLLLSANLIIAQIIHVPGDQPTIKAGIEAAVDGDTVLVQPGKYVERISFNGNAIVVGSLFLTTRDTSYISQTVIDGDTSGRVVIFVSGEEKTSILCGFTIQNGLGGIFCVNSSPTITYCTISHNSVNDTVKYFEGGGGGIHLYSSSPIISYCRISGNTSLGHPGGGGGICCSYNSRPEISHCIISNNSSLSNGGGIYSSLSSPTVLNCLITNNNSYRGAGIYCYNYDSTEVINCTITGNINPCYSCATIGVENFSSINIANSIIYGNTGGNSDVAVYGLFGFIHCYTSDIGSGYSGGTIISRDPLFKGGGDYSLQAGSPCIDAGSSSWVGWNSDLNGNQRSWDGNGDGTAIVDMGAYEYNSIPPEYDLEFMPLADMNNARYGAGYTCDGDNIYSICGGLGESPWISTSIERYDPMSMTWDMLATGLIPRMYCSAEYIEIESQKKIYIFNGDTYTNTSYTDTVEIVDVQTGELSYSATNPYPVEYGGSAVWDDKVYLFGGSNTDGFSSRLYEFDPFTSNWTKLPDMPEAKNTNGEIINGVLYVFGGYDGSVSKRIDAYNIQNKTWSYLGDMPVGISSHATTKSGENIFIVGSYDDIKFLAVYKTETNNFTQLSSNMIGRRHAGASVVEKNLYIFGGNQASDNSTVLKSLECSDISDIIISVREQMNYESPKEYVLSQNYPNPFNPSTTFKYEIPKESYITLKVYDILGREVATLVNEQQKAGYYEIDWNAANNSSGVYFYKIQAGDFVDTKKMILMK